MRKCPGAPDDPDASQAGNVGARSWCEVRVAVWLGYYNADGKRQTLGGGATGGGAAVPIFEPVIEAA